jgi:hypothetical protein
LEDIEEIQERDVQRDDDPVRAVDLLKLCKVFRALDWCLEVLVVCKQSINME